MPPALPDEYVVRFADTRQGRVFGSPGDAPPVVTVMGMAVSDYLTPAQAALDWTQAHLVDLPGLADSGDPPHRMDVPRFAEAVCDWLAAVELPPVIIAGHSSGTQVAAHVAATRPDLVAATVLASPTVDPKARSVPRVLYHWRRDSAYPMPGLDESHRPEWRRAGVRQLVHLLRAHLRDHLEETVPGLAGRCSCCAAGRTRCAPSGGRGSSPLWPRTAGWSRCPVRTRSCGGIPPCGRSRCGTSRPRRWRPRDEAQACRRVVRLRVHLPPGPRPAPAREGQPGARTRAGCPRREPPAAGHEPHAASRSRVAVRLVGLVGGDQAGPGGDGGHRRDRGVGLLAVPPEGGTPRCSSARRRVRSRTSPRWPGSVAAADLPRARAPPPPRPRRPARRGGRTRRRPRRVRRGQPRSGGAPHARRQPGPADDPPHGLLPVQVPATARRLPDVPPRAPGTRRHRRGGGLHRTVAHHHGGTAAGLPARRRRGRHPRAVRQGRPTGRRLSRRTGCTTPRLGRSARGRGEPRGGVGLRPGAAARSGGPVRCRGLAARPLGFFPCRHTQRPGRRAVPLLVHRAGPAREPTPRQQLRRHRRPRPADPRARALLDPVRHLRGPRHPRPLPAGRRTVRRDPLRPVLPRHLLHRQSQHRGLGHRARAGPPRRLLRIRHPRLPAGLRQQRPFPPRPGETAPRTEHAGSPPWDWIRDRLRSERKYPTSTTQSSRDPPSDG